MKVAAFFDFDKTLVAEDSQGLEGIHVLLKNHWHRSPLVTLSLMGAWVLDQLEERGLVPTGLSARVYAMAYRGINISQLIKSATELYSAQIRPRLYPDILRLLEEHRNQGHLIILLTATSEHIILPFADEVDNDGCFSTQLDCDSNGTCSGLAKVLHGKEKARVVEELAEAHKIDLRQSWAYSDHHGDIPLLEKVGNPVAVNPTKKLSDCAQRLGWRKLSTQIMTRDDQPLRKEQGKKNSAALRFWLTLLLISTSLLVVFSPSPKNGTGIRGAAVPPRGLKVERLCVVSYEPITHVEQSSGTIVYYRQVIAAALDRGIDVQVMEPHRLDDLPEVPYQFESRDGGGVLTTVRLEVRGDLGGGIVAFGPRLVRKQMRQNILDFAPDVIVIPDAILMAADGLMTSPGYYEAQKLGAALVYTIHTNVVDVVPQFYHWMGNPSVQWMLHTFHRHMLGHATMVFAQSENQVEHIRSETGFTGRIQINQFGLSKVCRAPVQHQDISSEIKTVAKSTNRSHCQTTFASIGRLSHDKHVDQILAAAEGLLKNDAMLHSICLVLAGPDQGLLGKVQQSVQGFPKNIFYEGVLNQQQVGSLMRSSDALVFIGGKVETLAIILGDAKDCHSPVLAVAAPGSTWWQNRSDLGHVDLQKPSPSESVGNVLMHRMKAFVENDRFRSELQVSAMKNNPIESSGSVEMALEEFLEQLDLTLASMAP